MSIRKEKNRNMKRWVGKYIWLPSVFLLITIIWFIAFPFIFLIASGLWVSQWLKG